MESSRVCAAAVLTAPECLRMAHCHCRLELRCRAQGFCTGLTKLKRWASHFSLGTVVWSDGHEASTCNTLWANVITISTKEKKKFGVYFIILFINSFYFLEIVNGFLTISQSQMWCVWGGVRLRISVRGGAQKICGWSQCGEWTMKGVKDGL